jgi:predicted kinase
MKPTLYLMMGYPGAGKTTIAKLIAEQTGAVLLSSDAVRMELFPEPSFSQSEHDQLYAALDTKTAELLRDNNSVIYDANLNRYEHRQEKYQICQETGAQAVLVWVRTSKEVAKERATHDSRSHLVPQSETPSAMFDRIADIIEEPRDDEPAVQIVGEDITPEIIKAKLNI